MRFCLVSTQEHWGGGEALMCAIGAELTLAGHGVSWIVRGGSEVAERLSLRHQQILRQLRGRGANLRDWLATRGALRSWVPDVVLLNDSHAVPLVGSAGWFCRTPQPLRLAYKHTIFPLRSQLKYRLLADKLICVSEAARETLVRGGLPAEHTRVIYGGCSPPAADADSRAAIRSEFGMPAGQRLLVCVGNLLECKGHGDLLQAMSQLVQTAPNLLLVIAGEGAERGNLERQIQQLKLQDHVRLLGYRDDAERLLAAADLVVHPSHAEGLSLVLIQAQMLGKPIVATAVGGTTEVLGADDASACTSWIAEARKPQSLADQLRLALHSLSAPSEAFARRLEQTARRTRETFDIASNTRHLADVCAQLIESRR